ncbi:MAG: VOC family protein [Actinobacteria bacterium]|nr:VOC family protein [Actinomycetota bacterium]
MLYYVSLNVSDIERSGSFYDAVLAPLGWRRQEDSPEVISWGMNRPALYITRSDASRPGFGKVSFPANSIPAVKASYESGLSNGGEPVAEPGAAPAHGGRSYAARLRDPDGYEVEIVSAPE